MRVSTSLEITAENTMTETTAPSAASAHMVITNVYQFAFPADLPCQSLTYCLGIPGPLVTLQPGS